ncbi:MAG: hypothetical protein U9N85_02835 [Bacteroidota bacterium]|nr:hypothetical protein [Bacteroidota bacterium]
MKLIICQSYLSIPATITFVEKEKDVLIISSNKHTYKFLSELYNQDKLIFVQNLKAFFSFNPLRIILNFIFNLKLKNTIKKRFSEFSGHEVYFMIMAFAPAIVYAVKILSKKNQIFYAPATKMPESYKRTHHLHAFVKKSIYKLLFNLDTDSYSNKKLLILKYNNKFFDLIKAKPFVIEKNENVLQKVLSAYQGRLKDGILLLTGGMTDLGLIDKKSYISVTDSLINRIGEEKLILKLHPRFNAKYSGENKLQEIDSHIPANLLLYSFEIIIGMQSSTLYEAANAGKCAISLLKIYPFTNDDYRNNYMNYLIENLEDNKKIYFPECPEELLQIINRQFNNQTII